jgi:hypothetical protein
MSVDSQETIIIDDKGEPVLPPDCTVDNGFTNTNPPDPAISKDTEEDEEGEVDEVDLPTIPPWLLANLKAEKEEPENIIPVERYDQTLCVIN